MQRGGNGYPGSQWLSGGRRVYNLMGILSLTINPEGCLNGLAIMGDERALRRKAHL